MTATPAKRPVGRPRKVPAEVQAVPVEPPQGIRVLVRRRVRSADGPEVVEEAFDWPRGWPLPDTGTVVLGREIGGFVNNVEMDLVNERVVVWLRTQ